MDFETRAIHDGQEPDRATGAVIPPIYQTSTFVQDAVGVNKGYDYSRSGNPTRTALETCLASLEGARHGLAYSSGLGATTTIMHLVNPGDHVVCVNDVYGGVYRIFSQVYEPKGYRFTYLSAQEIDAGLEQHLDEQTRVVWLETPSNPMLRIVDVAAVAQAAHEAGARVVVDNTFATPALQRPLELGADAVVHSVTKFIGGHSDLIGGAVVTSDAEWIERLGFLANAVGAVPGPMDCYLGLRGLKTLSIRMAKHSENAAAIASWLSGDPRVRRVYFPGLPDDPGHETASRQMSAFGGIVSFDAASAEEAIAIAERTELFFLAESLGGVESLIEVPGPMTHASVAGSPCEVPAQLVRLSVGLEHVDDLIADLDRALG